MNAAAQHTPERQRPEHSSAALLLWMGLIGIASIAVMRCAIVFAPAVLFDGDPAFDHGPLGALGPAGSFVLDVLLLVSCACAMWGQWRSGRGVDWLLLVLAVIPAPIIMWHAASDAGDMWRGSTWATAAIAAATVAHLARDRAMRIVLVACLSAAVVPILMRGAGQLTYEHAATVRYFEQHKDQFLRDRGWSPDSSAARIYERRLRQPQPTGWFATSNVLASVAAFGLVWWCGMSIAVARGRRTAPWAAAFIGCALAAAAGLWFTGSKGALMASVMGLALLGRLCGRATAKAAGPILIAMIAAALAAVVVRGALLPESFAAEKSLLFRWHYSIASARIFADNPVLGVGPDGFQEAYTTHRVPRNPEEVASPHSMFVDWLCAAGIAGAAWCALVVVQILRAGRWWQSAETADAPAAGALGAASSAVMLVAGLALLPALAVEWPTLDDWSVSMRVLGAGGFAIVGLLTAHLLRSVESRFVAASFVAAVGALLVHGQIEMTFTQPGSVVWALCAVGLLAPACRAGVGGGRWSNAMGLAVPLAILAMAAWLTWRGAVPAIGQQAAMARAAAMLQPIAADPSNYSMILQRRQASADELVRAYELWPLNIQPLEAAAIQLSLASAGPEGAPLGLLMRARDIVDRAIAAHGKPSSIALAVGLNTRLAMATGDREHWSAAIEHARRLIQIDPHGLSAWRRLGDVLWASGDLRAGAEAYRGALECDANFVLDELKQLSASERQRLLERITEADMQPSKEIP